MSEHEDLRRDQESREHFDADDWLRILAVRDLRRLAEICEVELPDEARKTEIIDILRKARAESERTSRLFREVARPATLFEAKGLCKVIDSRGRRLARQRSAQLNSELNEIKGQIKSLEAEAHRNESLRTVFGIIAGAVSFMIVIAAIAGLNVKGTLDEIAETKEKVGELAPILEKSLQNADVSNQDFRAMIITLKAHTGIQMIAKLNARLNRLRSMKLYHVKPTIRDLWVDIHGDLYTLKSLRGLFKDRAGDGNDQHLDSLIKISQAIVNLRRIYDDNETIDLTYLGEARKVWEELHTDIGIIKAELQARIGTGPDYDAHVFRRLQASVYQIEAGLAIEEYRASENKTGKTGLLQIAKAKCLEAIEKDASAPLSYSYCGLIASLKLSQLRKLSSSIEEIEARKKEAEEWYLKAVETSNSPELTVYALNGLAYLYFKTSDAYLDAANLAEGEPGKLLQIKARDMHKLAGETISNAANVPRVIDPIVWTTQADIAILRLRFATDEELREMRNDHEMDTILSLLKKAVEAGYSGYTGPKSDFFRRRPHFSYLQRLDENYEKLVSEAVGIADQ